MENTDKLAVLIDADNAQPSIVDGLLIEIDELLLDVANTTMQLNFAKETVNLVPAIHEQFLAGI